ncbi:hypothetical protein GCM10025868_14740 [Angustibacter aerolatus]|uniref:Uncharacterized protein n=1 Tax=Angustibacter aerolatus TaxID=1162965 RepID=A0ABQ6JGF3_9ACTN|nr:hypothetical protein [Angustibacter aerolatus]GMA86224.1 hypothetical protein GCM10025868_14740 [Angustibacter aerolatus]
MRSTSRPAVRRGLAVLLATSVAGLAGLAGPLTSAQADTAPPAGVPATVSADALPTVQIDGVAWSQAVRGNVVYVGGAFGTARPAGAAAGTSTTVRNNLLAYDITTGALITSFAPSLNAQVRQVSVSPDGTRVYVAGDFTQANGVSRNRVAAFNATTGALITSFAPVLNSKASSILATDTAIYVGGVFTSANGNARSKVAAFAPSNGGLLPWNPNADSTVFAMVKTPGGKVVLGGNFQNVGGSAAYGLAGVDAVTGAQVPWNGNQKVRNAGADSSINSLSIKGDKIYGSGYTYGAGGNLEGAFQADAESGDVTWVEDCHGDTYGVYPAAGAVYTVSHSHYCGNVDGFPQTEPWSLPAGDGVDHGRARHHHERPDGLLQLGRHAAPRHAALVAAGRRRHLHRPEPGRLGGLRQRRLRRARR